MKVLVDEGEVVAVDGGGECGAFAGREVAADERLDLRIVRAEAEYDDLVRGDDAADGLDGLSVHGGGRLRPVEVVEVEDGEDVMVLDEGNLLVVEASGELGRFVRMVGLSPRARRSGQRAGRPADRKDQLGQHLVDIGRMILRLGPIEGLGTRAPPRRNPRCR